MMLFQTSCVDWGMICADGVLHNISQAGLLEGNTWWAVGRAKASGKRVMQCLVILILLSDCVPPPTILYYHLTPPAAVAIIALVWVLREAFKLESLSRSGSVPELSQNSEKGSKCTTHP